VDFDAEKSVVFDQAWGWLRTHFHDPAMNGVDWPNVRAEFAPRVAAEHTPTELTRLLSMMVGELNASHCGVRPAGSAARTTGRLGLHFDRTEYERNGALRVSGLVPLGPAAVTGRIAAGDYLLAVNGVELTRGAALEQWLENQSGREVRLTLAADARGAGKREVAVKPVDSAAEKELLYREWVEKNRALVERLSGGRLGYVHMIDMGYESLLRLMADLDADNLAREGVVFDVRNNNGGFVNVYALDVIARRPYLNMTDRGWPTGPARRVLGQRALEKPTVLLTNQHSLSDAEDFAEGYRALGLGKVVGEPTAGWIIYTSNVPMIDGSVVRLPTTTITTAGGEPMEMHPRPVDVEVRRALGEDEAGKDSQIERAVAELLGGLAKK
jgi:tricorn protease